MKKFITLIACFSAFAFTGNSQITFGPMAGLNMSNISGMANSKMKMGFHIGGVAKMNFGNFYVMPGVLFSGKGTKQEVSALNLNLKTTTSVSYLEIPINVGYSFGESGFSIIAGPYLGFGIGGKIKAEAGGASASENIKFGSDANSDMKGMDFGVNVGAMYQLPMNLFVKAQYGIGLSDLAPVSGGTKFNNSNIQISVGYLFGGR